MGAHWRTRGMEQVISDALRWSPCVSVIGMRQTGKSSLVRHFAQNYLTFDDDSLVGRIEREGSAFLEAPPFPIGIDEVQKYPKFFNVLKKSIDGNRRTGRFLITGSIKFTNKREIRESLTGRAVTFELLPLSLAECHKASASILLQKLFSCSLPDVEGILSNLSARFSMSDLKEYARKGGMPGICFRRDEKVREHLYNQHLDTLLGRDIHEVATIKLATKQLRELFRNIIQQQGFSFNLSQMARLVGVSVPTVKKIIQAFETLFLIRQNGDCLYTEDLGIAAFVAPISTRPEKLVLQSVLHSELRSQISLASEPSLSMTSWESRGGASVPFLVELARTSRRIAITFDNEHYASEKSLKSLGACAKLHQDNEIILIALHCGNEFYMAGAGVYCVPLKSMF